MAWIRTCLSLVHVSSNKCRTTPALHDFHASSARPRLNWRLWRSNCAITWKTVKSNHQDFNMSESDEPGWYPWGFDQLRIYQWFMQRNGMGCHNGHTPTGWQMVFCLSHLLVFGLTGAPKTELRFRRFKLWFLYECLVQLLCLTDQINFWGVRILTKEVSLISQACRV